MSDDNSDFPKNIGLALGSGSARGWSHIGVIRALVEAGMEIRYIAGTSIGSLVGAACALDKMDVLEDFARQLDWKQIISFLDVTFPRSGLIDGKKISDFFRSHVREMNIEELPLRYCAVASDLATGREVVLNKGDIIEAIRASISVPGIFTPVRQNVGFLVDGGLVNPVPVSAVRKMGADYVIAVDLNHDIIDKRSTADIAPVDSSVAGMVVQPQPAKWKIAQELGNRFNEFSSPALSQVRQWLHKDPVPNIFDVLTTAINIMEVQITATRLATDPPDLLIRPKLGDVRFLEFHRAEETIAEGYREAMRQLKEKWGCAAKRDLPGDFLPGRTEDGN
ncbi:patatin-like phospholipase family protein [Desulfosarcina ovata]|nr:patatin-like phospholipase family protein [Desulfosarcina ovata]